MTAIISILVLKEFGSQTY